MHSTANCFACGRPLGLPWSVGGTIYHLCLVCWVMHLVRNQQAVALGKARAGEIVVIRHRHRGRVIVKVLCSDPDKLRSWGRTNGIPESWMHVSRTGIPHFDLWGRAAERIVR